MICTTTGEVFESISSACKKYNLNAPNVINCCKGKQKTCGTHPENGERLYWQYFKENTN